MKKLSLLTLILAVTIAFSSCKKDEKSEPGSTGASQISVDKKQRSMFIDFTATWCGPCGQWGIPTFQQALNTHKDNVVGFAVHATPQQTSDLVAYYNKPNNDTLFVSPLLGDFLGGINGLNLTGWPTLFLNSASTSSSATAINNTITAKAALEPTAGVGLDIKTTADGFTVRTGTKFFKDATGEYYLTVLVTEDGIVNRQNLSNPGTAANYNPSFVHNHISRGTAINTNNVLRPATFGDAAVASGSIKSGDYFESSYTFKATNFTNVPQGINVWVWNPAKSHVVAVLWKKNANNKFDFVNSVQKEL